MIGNYPFFKMILLTTIILGVPFVVLKLIMWFVEKPSEDKKPSNHPSAKLESQTISKSIEHNASEE
ncbi:MAG: hypothetical protein ACK4GL_05680 [Flavobacteriales bacterium]